MNDRDEHIPAEAATRAVIGQNRPTFLEQNIPQKVDQMLREYYPGQYEKFFRPFLERKKTESGHARRD